MEPHQVSSQTSGYKEAETIFQKTSRVQKKGEA